MENPQTTSILMSIQDTVVQYADILSQISRVDVEVVDDRLFRVAGTGIFSQVVNQSMASEGYVYQKVLETGRRQIIYEPGRELICGSCPHRNACREEIEISMPVRMENKIIGVIGLVGSSPEQKERILNEETLYMDFLSQIADFISTKAKEQAETENQKALLGTLNTTIGHIEEGILILGGHSGGRRITTANSAAKEKLEIQDLEGRAIQITPTGDRINDLTEYKLIVGDREFAVLGELHALSGTLNHYKEVMVFHSSKDIQKKYYSSEPVNNAECSNIIGSSPQTQRLKSEIIKVARGSSTVLITGESGTGKEMVATAIWNASRRKNSRFVAINCAAIPETLLESELFGYVKGAFSGADPNGRMGKFELANKGVIFLDEIGDMPLFLQAKLLRVLQERKVIRIGSNHVIPIDVRVLAATNKDLKQMIRENKFREDLYYRLNVIPLQIPPLRERREDIPELAVFFARRYAKLFEKEFWKITDDVMERLMNCRWEGNVRELENVLEFMVNMMQDDGILGEDTLPAEFVRQEAQYQTEQGLFQTEENQYQIKEGQRQARGEQFQANGTCLQAVPSAQAESEVTPLKELERQEIQKALSLCGSSTQGKKEAARRLGISLATLYRKLEEFA